MAGRDESKDRRAVPPARCRHGSKVPPEGHYSGSRHWTHAGQGVQEDCPLKPVSQLLGSRFARTVGTSTTTASQSRSWSGIRTWRRRRTWQRQHYSARYARIALFMMKSPAGFSEWRALQAASDAEGESGTVEVLSEFWNNAVLVLRTCVTRHFPGGPLPAPYSS